MYVPRVNPKAGETKRVPKVENAPVTGYMEDISPLVEWIFGQMIQDS